MRKTEELQAEIRGAFFHGREALKTLRSLKEGQPLLLIREPQNRWDGNAIIVATLYGRRCGYVAREIAARVAPEIDSGWRWLAKVYSEATKKEKAVALLWREEDEEETKTGTEVAIFNPRQKEAVE